MKFEITCKTGKGRNSRENEVKETYKAVMKIAEIVNGHLIDGKGLTDGTKVILEK